MANFCDCCGKENNIYMKPAVFQDGKKDEVYLCEDCLYKFEQSNNWFETKRGYIIKRNNSENYPCFSCGTINSTSIKQIYLKNGETTSAYLCKKCSGDFNLTQEKLFESLNEKIVDISNKNSLNNVSSGWSEFTKIINVCVLIGLSVLGMILGSSFSYYDDEKVLFGFLGGIVGALIGGMFVSFSMMIVEISKKLSAILDELKKK